MVIQISVKILYIYIFIKIGAWMHQYESLDKKVDFLKVCFKMAEFLERFHNWLGDCDSGRKQNSKAEIVFLQ